MLQVAKQAETVPTEQPTGYPEITASGAATLQLPDKYRNPRGTLWASAVVMVVAMSCLGAWIALAPLGSATQASGSVAVESSHRTIQHLEGGLIKEILVTDGSVVKAGDVLLRLHSTQALAQLEILRNALDLAQATEARLLSEREGLPAPVFPSELLAREQNGAVATILTGQRNIFQTRRTALDGQKAILKERIGQYKQQIIGLKALEVSKNEQARYIKEELNGLVGLMNEGIVPKTRVLAMEREASRLEGERGDHISAIARSEQGIGETQFQILQLDKTRQEEIAKEIRDVQASLAELKQKMIAASDVKKRIEITAPVSGTVMSLAYHTIGGVISPGAPIMEIVPSDEEMVIECQFSSADIDTIHVGSVASLQINVVGARLIPVIFGVLKSVSPDRITDQKSGMSYFKGRITISKEEIDRLGTIQIYNGMMVGITIPQVERTFLSLVLRPVLDSFSRSFREK